MTNSRKLYTCAAVSNYITNLDPEDVGIYCLPGCLADNYIIFHYDAAGDPAAVEVLKEFYLNPWESGTARNLYRARVPLTVIQFVESFANDSELTEDEKLTIHEIVDLLEDFNTWRKK